jgi:hypothetical protein
VTSLNEIVRYNSLAEADRDLALEMADLADDPLEWVRFAYPWGEGPLDGFDGPDDWQAGFFREWGEEIRLRGFDGTAPVMPYRCSTTSGHGVGKSALVGQAIGFIMSTRPHCRGRVTANSLPQLATTTWPEMVKWMEMCITRRWFRITSGRGAMKMVHRQHEETWRIDGLAWDEHRPAAFAGLHAAKSSPFYILDEASEIPRIICETAMGGLTDGEPFFFMFGNPTKPSGFFFDSHNDMRDRFRAITVDSRTAKMTNKGLIKEWIEDFGIDSDFVKVRVLGEFPTTGDRQFIPSSLVTRAMSPEREPIATALDPVIIGCDPARYGGDEATIYIRRGRDMRTHAPKIFRGISADQLAMEIKKLADELLPDAINIDSGGGGAQIIDFLVAWGVPNVNEVNFGGTSLDPEYADMATYMMAMLRKWLHQDGVTLPIDPVLKRQMTSRQYALEQGTKSTVVRIEKKETLKKREEEGKGESPDRADGSALTFAVPVPVRDIERTKAEIAGMRPKNVVGVEYERSLDGARAVGIDYERNF